MNKWKRVALFCLFLTSNLFAQDWSSEASLPGKQECFEFHSHRVCLNDDNRANILDLSQENLESHIYEGAKHITNYPVDISGMLIPYRPLKEFFNQEKGTRVKKLLSKIAKSVLNMKDITEVYKWLGLHEIPISQPKISPNRIPVEMKDGDFTHLGVSILETNNTRALTMSCATCHTNNLFGTPVVGLTNRFPRANDFFILGRKGLKLTNPLLFKELFNATEEEMDLFRKSKRNIKFIEAKSPIALGLDTSLAQVGLSLSRRAKDEYASKKEINALFPRKSHFREKPADSKPAVWWNLKYKTRWLSDGSIVSGNPLYTNLLWNEIGRGTDLKELEVWLEDNQDKIDELTAYVFSSRAPLYDDFFPSRIDIELAKQGEKLFVQNCSGCHGIYEKGWSSKSQKTYRENIKTVKVRYHSKTPVIDVGTDPLRYQGMEELSVELNRLAISKKKNILIVPQKGYVPPPLVGIWARFPYFHNNSVPTLYDVLTPDYKRPKIYRMTETLYPETDFDFVKNGYPSPEKMREPFKSKKKYLYNTNVLGLSNQGHTEGILLDDNGVEKFAHEDKLALIEFLKTL